MVVAVKTSPLIANSGTKYVKIAAVGTLAVLLGTWEFLLKTVGRLKTANPPLPIEIKRSTSQSIYPVLHKPEAQIIRRDHRSDQPYSIMLPQQTVKG
jgi:hypothetical protein